jgi:hypothetical protein
MVYGMMFLMRGMLRPLLVILTLQLLTGLVACLPLATRLPPWPTDTPLPPTGTPTPTIVWFPPTPTYTPLPTVTLGITPTLDTQPAYGPLIFADNFSHSELWNKGRTANGSIAFGKNELTLAISQARVYLYSLRQDPILDDFYLEITASPSICRSADEYGLLLRVSPGLDFYRFALTCDGQARVDRYLNSQASSPQPPKPNGAIPPGAPSTSRLGIWAAGKEMRFYANGQYLFTIRDSTLPSGSLGLFARTAGSDMMTVTFSDLAVYQVIE